MKYQKKLVILFLTTITSVNAQEFNFNCSLICDQDWEMVGTYNYYGKWVDIYEDTVDTGEASKYQIMHSQSEEGWQWAWRHKTENLWSGGIESSEDTVNNLYTKLTKGFGKCYVSSCPIEITKIHYFKNGVQIDVDIDIFWNNPRDVYDKLQENDQLYFNNYGVHYRRRSGGSNKK